MLYVVVTYFLNEAKAEAFIKEIEQSQAAAKVRAEDGCLRYDYYCLAPDRVLLMETWESLEKQKVHLTQPHMDVIREIKSKYCNSSEVEMLPQGRYRHYKGNEYELLSVSSHSETLEPMVVYKALYGAFGTWVRPASMWNEKVEVGGKIVPRFELVEENKN